MIVTCIENVNCHAKNRKKKMELGINSMQEIAKKEMELQINFHAKIAKKRWNDKLKSHEKAKRTSPKISELLKF